MGFLLLALAIVFELAGTITMKFSGSLTKWLPSIMMYALYGCSLTSLTFAVKSIDISIAYAIWSGLGTALIAVVGFYLFNEQITLLKMVFILLIIIGVVGLNMASTSSKSGHSGQIQEQEQHLDSIYEKRM
jgi:small multidrug resistance pump